MSDDRDAAAAADHPDMIPDWVALRARTHAETLAVEAADGSWTYSQLDRRVQYVADRLRGVVGAGVRQVALLHVGDSRFAALAHGIPRSGHVLMPLNARLTATEIAWQLRDADAAVVVADDMHEPLAREAGSAAGVPVLQAVDVAAEKAARSHSSAGDLSVSASAPHSVLYTSGTTGLPKGAVLTHGNFYWSAVASALNIGTEPTDRWLACLPLFHVAGLSILLRSAILGTAALIHSAFDESDVWNALSSGDATLVSLVATQLQRVLDVADGDFSPRVRAALIGGGPVPEDLLRRAGSRGLRVLQTYGLTETASQVTTLGHDEAQRKLGSAGQPLAATTLRLEVDGAEAPSGMPGEILVSGRHVSPGYLGSNGRLEARDEGWLRTGDIGVLDAEGFLTVLDRRDDLIVSGGENVYPAEVESVLLAHDDVQECAVVGLPDERWGQVVAAVVVASSEHPPDFDALEAHARQHLAGFKVPRRLMVSPVALPRTASGKLLRRDVRVMFERDSSAG